MLGRLKRSLSERCPECGYILQIRTNETLVIRNGVQAYVTEEYITCSNKNCGYEREMEQKRRRRQEDDLTY